MTVTTAKTEDKKKERREEGPGAVLLSGGVMCE